MIRCLGRLYCAPRVVPVRNPQRRAYIRQRPSPSRRLVRLKTELSVEAFPAFRADVFFAVSATIGKLALICLVVNALTKSERLPANTSTILSKLSYELTIPCVLFTRVATLLASRTESVVVYGLTLAIVIQISVGAALGALASTLLSGAAPPETRSSGIKIPELRRLVTMMCAFGNIWTLPIFFLITLYPLHAELAISYVAFCVVGWNPLFWVAGSAVRQPPTPSRGTPWRRLVDGLSKLITPPTTAIVAGIVLGSLPLGRRILSEATVGGAVERGVLAGVAMGAVRLVLDVMNTLAGATMGVQAIILGAAFSSRPADSGELSQEAAFTPALLAFVMVAVVRFLLMPFVGWGSFKAVSALGLVPPNDGVFAMTILLMSVMPPAQSAVLLFNLRPETRRLVPFVARMIVGLYVVSVIPITLWLTYFSTLCW